MEDTTLQEIKNQMYDYENDWTFDTEKEIHMHPTRIFGYGSLSEDLKKHLSETNLEELFLPKPDWVFYAFRECDLLKLNSFLTFVKAYFLKTYESPPYPLVLQIDNGNYILIAPMQIGGDDPSRFKGLPAWYFAESFLFDFLDDVDTSDFSPPAHQYVRRMKREHEQNQSIITCPKCSTHYGHEIVGDPKKKSFHCWSCNHFWETEPIQSSTKGDVVYCSKCNKASKCHDLEWLVNNPGHDVFCEDFEPIQSLMTKEEK